LTADASPLPFWRVAHLTGTALPCLDGRREDEVALFACSTSCAPIPWQLDERDAQGDLALPQVRTESRRSARAHRCERRAAVDGRGRGTRDAPEEQPPAARCSAEIALRSGETTAYVYAFALPAPAPRSPVRYVEYDPARDLITAARVAIGFGAATPRYMALRGADGQFGTNQLDRLKVRASARFLGLIPLGRNEDDIQWAFGAWHAGPIRVARREWQWVRLGWGLRTPIFRTESFIYRDSVELPVRLRLNFPPTYFFRGIEVQAALDFRGLRGWTVRTPSGPLGTVGAIDDSRRADGDWLALEGPDLTFVLRLQLGDSLASLRREILYREGDQGSPPRASRASIRRWASLSPNGAASIAASTVHRRRLCPADRTIWMRSHARTPHR
jgi:hypothetical protein